MFLARTGVVGDLHREVALKMMHPQLAAGSEDAAQLIEEAKLTASIRHPNVVGVQEAGEDPCGVYMVMDYVDGDTLSGVMRAARASGQHLPLPIVARVLCDALAGLHAAHELTDAAGAPVGLVHRDFSPSNLLMGIDGGTRLADFGIAKARSRLSVTTTGAIKGKIAYMAPEQVLGQPLDRRCDVWAAGVIAWECLAGERLYPEADEAATMFRIVQTPPPRLISVRSDLPEALVEAVTWALTIERDARCPTADALRSRLVAAFEAMGPLAAPAEVGAYVARCAAEKIEQRRTRVQAILERREMLPSFTGAIAAGEPTKPPPPDAELPTKALPRGTATPAEARFVGAVSTEHTRAPQAGRPRTRALGRALLSALGVGVFVVPGAWAISSRVRPSAPAESPLPVVAAPITASIASAEAARDAAPRRVAPPPEAPVTLSPSRPDPPAQRADVLVKADARIESLVVGARVIPLAQPVQQLTVSLADSEREGGVELTAIAVDKRRANAVIAPGAATVALSFGRAPSTPKARVAPRNAALPELHP